MHSIDPNELRHSEFLVALQNCIDQTIKCWKPGLLIASEWQGLYGQNHEQELLGHPQPKIILEFEPASEFDIEIGEVFIVLMDQRKFRAEVVAVRKFVNQTDVECLLSAHRPINHRQASREGSQHWIPVFCR